MINRLYKNNDRQDKKYEILSSFVGVSYHTYDMLQRVLYILQASGWSLIFQKCVHISVFWVLSLGIIVESASGPSPRWADARLRLRAFLCWLRAYRYTTRDRLCDCVHYFF